MLNKLYIWSFIVVLVGCRSGNVEFEEEVLAERILTDSVLSDVKTRCLEVIKTGFNAGDSYEEVWIRDYNSFIGLSAEVHEPEMIKENLRVFFRLQGEDGNIVDGFIPREKAIGSNGGYDYIYTDLEKKYAGHKNTVETDQESSLIQAVYKYIRKTGDTLFLDEKIGGVSVTDRMEDAMDFLMKHRLSSEYQLLWGATTADWGDVQPEHDWGVYLTEDTHYAIDVYDNAMFLISMNNLSELSASFEKNWKETKEMIAANTMRYLWDEENEKFIPHLYLNGSPFPSDFDEDQIYYHGGTTTAIQAGLLSREQVRGALIKMQENVELSGASSIGLTLYPPYPAGYFKNEGMYPYGYQNGGDWTWFGARMISALIEHEMIAEAYQELLPMAERVIENDGFYEWYTVNNEPNGSGTFRGSAGVLYEAIEALESWAKNVSVRSGS